MLIRRLSARLERGSSFGAAIEVSWRARRRFGGGGAPLLWLLRPIGGVLRAPRPQKLNRPRPVDCRGCGRRGAWRPGSAAASEVDPFHEVGGRSSVGGGGSPAAGARSEGHASQGTAGRWTRQPGAAAAGPSRTAATTRFSGPIRPGLRRTFLTPNGI